MVVEFSETARRADLLFFSELRTHDSNSKKNADSAFINDHHSSVKPTVGQQRRASQTEGREILKIRLRFKQP